MKSNHIYVPSTFEERGVAVPFTTPALTMSRIRPDDRESLLLLIPCFGGTETIGILPWRNVPEMVTLSTHDRMLYEEALSGPALTPGAMRTCALKVAETGLAGPANAEAAAGALAEDVRRVEDLNVTLVLALLVTLGVATRDLQQTEQESREWRHRIRGMLKTAAHDKGLDILEVYRRMELVSHVLAPVGVGGSRTGSRLHRLFVDLEAFRASLARWAEEEVSELADVANLAALTAETTRDIAANMFAKIDELSADLGQMLRDWDRKAGLITHTADRLSWLLDGWDFLVAMWAELKVLPIEQQRSGILNMMPILPVIPDKEYNWDRDVSARKPETPQPRSIALHMDWRSGKYDIELVSRIESFRARAITQSVAPVAG